MRKFTAGTLTAYAPDYEIYRSDRIIIAAATNTVNAGYLTIFLHDHSGEYIEMNVNSPKRGMYYYFDITDVVMTYNDDDDIYVSVEDDGDNPGIQEEIELSIRGFINPAYLPPHPVSHIFEHTIEYIMPPSRILKDLGDKYPQNAVESQYIGSIGIAYGDSASSAVNMGVINYIPYGADIIQLYEERAGRITNKNIKIAPLLDCEKYACVRWVSRTGKVKVATWKVRQVQEETTERLELLTISGPANVANTHPVDVRKKYDVNLHLYLDGLTAYDYWYYCDIINSPRVEVFLNGDGDEDKDINIVDVLTKSATYPDSNVNAPYELDVEIKLNEYDTCTYSY